MEIKLVDLVCGYPSADILGPINLSFHTNEICCILGSNGIGKTTLFKTLLGFIPAKRGSILIGGNNIDTMHTKEMARFVSYVPQAKNYSYQYSVLETVLMGRASYVKPYESPSEKDYSVADAMLEKLQISHLKHKLYAELSGGEQQVVLIARALAQEARFIVMDEPASNLDFENQKKVLDVLKSLANNDIGIIMSSHSPDHAFYCGTTTVMVTKDRRIIYGQNGNVLCTENLKEVYGVDVEIISKIRADGQTLKTCCLL